MERQRRQLNEQDLQERVANEQVAPEAEAEGLKTPVDGEGNPIDVPAVVAGDAESQSLLHGYGTVEGLAVNAEPVESAYIGETEKNLSRQIDSAEATDNPMLFDEADALFGKRTEVRDSHDKYANQEVSYLKDETEQAFRPEIEDEVIVGFAGREDVSGFIEVSADKTEEVTGNVQQIDKSTPLLDEAVVANDEPPSDLASTATEPAELVEALGSEMLVHQPEESGETTRINEEGEIFGRESVAGFVEVPADAAQALKSETQAGHAEPQKLGGDEIAWLTQTDEQQVVPEDGTEAVAAGTNADLTFEKTEQTYAAEVKMPDGPLEFKSVAGMDSETVVEAAKADATSLLPDGPEVSLEHEDSFMEQANPLSEQVDAASLPEVEMEPLALDIAGDLEPASLEDDDDPGDVI